MLSLPRPHRLLRYINRTSYKKCRCYSETKRVTSITEKLKSGPDLKDFITGISEPILTERPHIPYLPDNIQFTTKRKVFFDVYGCQMNLNDTEIVWSILKKEGFEKTEVEEEADIFLVMTCAIREGAESKIWHRLDHLRGFKRRAMAKNKNKAVKIGILGCMAERLKEKLIEKEKAVDIVAGPDSYRDLPRLLALTESGQTAVNVLLSLDETYADVAPVRLNQDSISAFISIMRGCDNMCTYCIVPFTRGRERSRPSRSVVQEVRELADSGVREVTLLGQNVNSYRDAREEGSHSHIARGFKTVYKPKKGGLRFADLLDLVSAVDPEMRIRFTAAHPKDFPDEVLQIVSERRNICKMLHLPAQSGSTAVLKRMRRGYSREAYLDLVQHVTETIPGVGLSTDMICGFCGETDEEFEETLTLMDQVDYNMAFLFPYSMREKTTAYRRFQDDVPEEIKRERHSRMLELYRRKCQKLYDAEIGNVHLILVEGTVKKTGQIFGRNELYTKVVFDQMEVPMGGDLVRGERGYCETRVENRGYGIGGKVRNYGIGGKVRDYGIGGQVRDYGIGGKDNGYEIGGQVRDYGIGGNDNGYGIGDKVRDYGIEGNVSYEIRGEVRGYGIGSEVNYAIGGDNRGYVYGGEKKRVEKGDYVAVKIVGAKSSVLSGIPLYHTSLTEFYRERGWSDRAVKI